MKLQLSLALSFTFAAMPVLAGKLSLDAPYTDAAMAPDGAIEAAWNKAPALTIHLDQLTYEPSTGYDGITETDVEIRSLYNDTHVFFLIQWQDPTHSIARWPWEKQADGSWKQLSRLDSTSNENFHYEDKLTIAWNISERGFAKKGCEQSCHMAEDGKIDDTPDRSAGRHYTDSAGQTVDVWHWKSARTNPVGRVDDQYFDHSRNENPEWGRKSDDNDGGGYKDNIADGLKAPMTAGSGPQWMPRKISADNQFWIKDEEKIPFVDTFKPGDLLAGVIVKPYLGSRGDIETRGVWKDGVWTLEIKRPRTTAWAKSAEQDVQFSAVDQVYYFGVGIYDNSQINHFYHAKAIHFRLLPL